jgi:hypothetical protein
MATSNLNFAAQVDDWAKETQDRLERIFKASSQELASIAINGTPVDTGFARASWRVSTEAMPQIDPAATNKSHAIVAPDLGEISASIASAKLGGTLFVGATAAYIVVLEYGHSKQAPQGFARLAAAQWPAIVARVTAEAKSRAA